MQEDQILIVDDYQALRESLGDILEGENRKIFLAENGLEALKIIKENNIRVVISDIKMPKMDGFQLLKKIKERPISPYVLLISGHSDYNRQQILDAGAIDFMSKPVQLPDLMKVIEKLLTKE